MPNSVLLNGFLIAVIRTPKTLQCCTMWLILAVWDSLDYRIITQQLQRFSYVVYRLKSCGVHTQTQRHTLTLGAQARIKHMS